MKTLQTKKASLELIAIALLCFPACRRDPSNWDVDIAAPIATASLKIDDIVPSEYVVANTDSSLKVVYQNSLYSLPLDSLLKLPDTTFTTPTPFLPAFTLNPGQQLPAINNIMRFNLNGASLNRVIIDKGELIFTANSVVPGPIDFNYKIPKATKNGVSLDLFTTIAPGQPGNPSIASETLDLSGYDFDLSGNLGSDANVLAFQVTTKISDSAPGTVTVQAGIPFTYDTKFTGIRPYYVQGYFGTTKTSIGPDTVNFDFLKNIVAGSLTLEDINLVLTLDNSIGADMQVTIKDLKGINRNTGNVVSLQHQILNSPVNIDRAVNLGLYNSPQYESKKRVITFTSANSNLTTFLANLPDQIIYKTDIQVNPLGNISGGKDFLYKDANIDVSIDLEVPLSFKSNNLTIVDTLDYDLSKNQSQVERFNGGEFYLRVENGFPLDAQLELLLLDSNNVVVENLSPDNIALAAPVNAEFKATGKQLSTLTFTVTKEQREAILKTKNIVVRAVFNTVPNNQFLKMYSWYSLDVFLTSKFNYNLQF